MAEKKSESVVREIKRRTRRKYSAEEKIATVLYGLRGEESISAMGPSAVSVDQALNSSVIGK